MTRTKRTSPSGDQPNDLERMSFRIRNVKELRLNPSNERKHSRSQIKQIGQSILNFGFNVPVLIDRDDNVICGHGRLLACEVIGREQVPTICIDDLTPTQVRGFAIAENRSGDTSSFDERLLAISLKELAVIDLDFDIEAVGFSMAEIDIKIEGLEADTTEAADPDDALPAPGPAVSRTGDVWLLGKHRIICGDALDATAYAKLLRGERVDGGFSDPPYGSSVAFYFGKGKYREFVSCSGELDEAGLATFFDQAFSLAADHFADGAIGFSCTDWRHLPEMLAASGKAFDELLNIVVWAKNNAGMGSLYRSEHELILVLKKGRGRHRNNVQLGKHGRNRTNVWKYPGANTFMRSSEEADLLAEHATPKPVKMIADALLDVTARGDRVLDNFLGTGSTLMACERIGRRCRGIERDPQYVDLTVRRWQRMTGEAAILESTSKSFDEVASTLECVQ